MFSLLKWMFGSAHDRQLTKFRKIVEQINETAKSFENLTESQLVDKTQELKQRYQEGTSLDDLLVEAYATVKQMCRSLLGQELEIADHIQKWEMVPFDVQLLGAIAMHNQSISEMQTGEGKTLTAVMPLYLNALTGKPVHLVTVNDYLAKRDCDWVGVLLRKLGLSTASLVSGMSPEERKQAYSCDVVYGTASEFGFDYLRDNSTATRLEEQVQRGHFFAIIDEVDSILIDEARTPLIISGPVPDSRQMYAELKYATSSLVKNQRDLCNRLATEAKMTLKDRGFFDFEEQEQPVSFKELSPQEQQASKKLWLVSKGTPRNKILKRALESPSLRSAIDQWDLYYYSEQHKHEKGKALSELFILVDEKSNEYELTDKGISQWALEESGHEDDFVMLDISEEFEKIEKKTSLSHEEKELEKAKVQEEDRKRKERTHNLRQLLRAHLLMEKDVDYIISDQKIVIIDENTGRPQPGRRFSDGLHQAIEAKENVSIQQETQTYATITLQNYFRLYKKLAGMSGTAVTEAQELKEIYKLEVLPIPTYKKCLRKDANDEVYMTEREKYQAILKEINKLHNQQRPILIGTESVEVSEKLSRVLKQNKLPHTVLNAKNHAKEAEIIADAGKSSAITISTNMAGRGTDIKLDAKAKQAGGLHVIGTTRHASRRIDRQLRGRCARLGDPGSSKFYVSFEDSLMRLFAPPALNNLLKRLNLSEGEPISAGILNKSIETAQKRLEQRNYMMRKHTLEYDDVMNRQRKEIYNFRNEVLHTDKLYSLIEEMIEEVCWEVFDEFHPENIDEEDKEVAFEHYINWLNQHFPIQILKKELEDAFHSQQIENMIEYSHQKISLAFKTKLEFEKDKGQHLTQEGVKLEHDFLTHTVKEIIIRKIDQLWQEHLLAMDNLRSDVQMRSVGQKDPLMEFKTEAFILFSDLSSSLKKAITQAIFQFEIIPFNPNLFQENLKRIQLETDRTLALTQEEFEETKEEGNTPESPITKEPETGRNELCPCQSGKKFKKCCGKVSQA